MFSKISNALTEALVQSHIIAVEDRDIYYYGIQQGLIALLNFVTTLILGCLCGLIWESIIYMFSYIPLRHYTGGFHAKSPARCYVFSILLLLFVLSAMKQFRLSCATCCVIAASAFIIISILAPVEDHNKPLDSIERQVFRKRASLISGIESTIVVVSLEMHAIYIARCISWCLVIAVIMMGIGIAKNHLIKEGFHFL